MAALYPYCDELNVLPDGTCAEWQWKPESAGLLPPLSITDANTIAAAFAGFWALAWCIRQLMHQVKTGHQT